MVCFYAKAEGLYTGIPQPCQLADTVGGVSTLSHARA